jgi:hypothetical protein
MSSPDEAGLDQLVRRLEVVELRPDDVIMVTLSSLATDTQASIVRSRLASRFPGNRVAIISDQIRIDVYRPGEEPTSDPAAPPAEPGE